MVRRLLTALALLGAASAMAAPTLLGDTLTFARGYPDPSTPYGVDPLSVTTTVAAGTSDQVAWSSTGGWGAESGITYARFNAEATSIEVSLPNSGVYIDTAPGFFDGYVISGFDHDIVDASGNYSGLTLSWLSRELRLDFLGAIPVGSFTIELRLADDPVQGVPEPGAAWLVGTALLLTAGARRSRPRRA